MAQHILREFLRVQENAPLAAGSMSAMRHSSPEGGTDTIGFGHKLTAEEQQSGRVGGIDISKFTMSDAEDLLDTDIKAKRRTLDKRLRKRHNVRLSSLPLRKQEMLLDFEFNLGDATGKFPSFTKALLDDDEAGQKDEMMRSFTDADGVKKPLARNAAFFNTFMSRDAQQRFGE